MTTAINNTVLISFLLLAFFIFIFFRMLKNRASKELDKDLLEEAWEQREEDIYLALFGKNEYGIYPLDAEVFEKQFDVHDIDPRWLHYGVMKFAPNEQRESWVYVTSGMSNPWLSNTIEKKSGLGSEFLLEYDEESDLPILLLQNLMAYNILLSIGHFEGKFLLEIGDRVALKIEPNLSYALMAKPQNFPETIKLVSGDVDLIQVLGITKKEWKYAKEHSSQHLVTLMIKKQCPFLLNPYRNSIV